jgi:hypothetical protein
VVLGTEIAIRITSDLEESPRPGIATLNRDPTPCRLQVGDRAHRGGAAKNARTAAVSSPSPLNGERVGVRGGMSEVFRRRHVSPPHHPSPSFPLPIEGRGRPAGSRSEKFAPPARILTDTDRLKSVFGTAGPSSELFAKYFRTFGGKPFISAQRPVEPAAESNPLKQNCAMKNLLLSLIVATVPSSSAARASILTVTSTAEDGRANSFQNHSNP